MVTKMLTELGRRRDEHSKNLKQWKTIKYQTEVRAEEYFKVKNILEVFNRLRKEEWLISIS